MKVDDRTNHGFALVVVLSTLSIIALLVASSTTRLLSRKTEIGTEERIARQAQEGAALVRFALEVYGNGDGQASTVVRLPVLWLDVEAVLYLQDVGGLVDLNTAGAGLLDELVQVLGISDEALRRYRDWRRTPHRLQQVSDFERVAGLDWQEAKKLSGITTVHSGRLGISTEHAPRELIDLLEGARRTIPEEWQSSASGRVYEVRLEQRDDIRILGVISLSHGGSKGRTLEIR